MIYLNFLINSFEHIGFVSARIGTLGCRILLRTEIGVAAWRLAKRWRFTHRRTICWKAWLPNWGLFRLRWTILQVTLFLAKFYGAALSVPASWAAPAKIAVFLLLSTRWNPTFSSPLEPHMLSFLFFFFPLKLFSFLSSLLFWLFFRPGGDICRHSCFLTCHPEELGFPF